MKKLFLALAVTSLAAVTPALAQAVAPLAAAPAAAAQQPGVDPRLALPTINALKALLDLRESELRALGEDARKKLEEREKAWADYARPLYAPAATAPAPAKPE